MIATVTNADRDKPILSSEIVAVAGGQLVVSDDISRQNGHVAPLSVDVYDQPSAQLEWVQVTESLQFINHQDDIVLSVELPG